MDPILTPIFVGPFAEELKRFLEQKRALGYKYGIESWMLKDFDRYTKEKDCHESNLSEEVIVEWAKKRPNETSGKTSYSRYSLMRQLGLFLVHNGKIDVFVPELPRKPPSGFAPYIFTHGEIKKLFSVLDSWDTDGHRSDIFNAMPVLFRMIYGCGLRISEALDLLNDDVDLDVGTIHIINSKFMKERLLPMSDSLLAVCRKYVAKKEPSEKNDFFFQQRNGTQFTRRRIYSYFRQAIFECGIPHKGRTASVRVHDLRHTFAVHSLNKLEKENIDVYAALPSLSAYMGHSNLSSTSTYLRLTAEVFPDILQQVEQYFNMDNKEKNI